MKRPRRVFHMLVDWSLSQAAADVACEVAAEGAA